MSGKNALHPVEFIDTHQGRIVCNSIRHHDGKWGVWVHIKEINSLPQNTKVHFHWRAKGDENVNADITKVIPFCDEKAFLAPYDKLMAPVQRGNVELSYSYTDGGGQTVTSPVTHADMDFRTPGGVCQFQ
ncbi:MULTISPECIES: hypothetical protein [unclassified Pseudomonas]|uniref:hypothetical protein n=1 Tax=unclassified Pseudomonas TaxID=196821 RepID=UPI0008EF52DF|nr:MULTISPECIES: hypothetical protein [unclassified Pseudomonas]SFB11425.1 hypothetical protein SAMN03159485_02812 [Pseudomonas sp. NFPP24]SFO83256.1 hypothetical protein SAMN03159315_00648 [Pseudomonas sp. NFPP28]